MPTNAKLIKKTTGTKKEKLLLVYNSHFKPNLEEAKNVASL